MSSSKICLPSVILISFILAGCSGIYFQDAELAANATPLKFGLDRWPYSEYWAGVIFNGKKIGFTHLTLQPADGRQNAYEIRSEAFLAFRFWMVDKTVTLKSRDRVGRDLRLQRFDYEYVVDGSRLQISGSVQADQLKAKITSTNGVEFKTFKLSEPVFPAAAVLFYPLFQGLELGRSYRYAVFDGETRSVTTVVQKALAYETSPLFDGPAFKIRTSMHAQKVSTWISPRGLPVLETAARGLLISAPESRRQAERYLTEAAFSKDEALLEYCLIKPNAVIANPRRVSAMKVLLRGFERSFSVPVSEWQDCTFADNGTECFLSRPDPVMAFSKVKETAELERKYLQPSMSVNSRNPLIAEAAADITCKSGDDVDRIRRILAWMQQNIEKKALDSFTAADVFVKRQAECQGHAFLATAFMRAVNIPARVVNGIVYSKDLEGFMYHTWVEALAGGRWVPLDPVFNQFPADATHLKLVEGEDIADLVPLVGLFGRLKVDILSFE